MRMPNLLIAAPTVADSDELLAFELKNRAFFEKHINARPTEYYSVEGMRMAIATAVEDARAGTAFQYLVRDEAEQLIGRVNLSRVKRSHFHSAEVGYRVAEDAGGRGVATEAVRLAMIEAFSTHRLHRLEATSRPENSGSIRVLHGNGFKQFGRSLESFQLHGTWFDLLHFERHAHA